MAANFIQTLAQAMNSGAAVTSQNPGDMICAALEGKADLADTISRLMSSGISVQDISNIFTNLGIQQSSAVGAYIKAVGVMGTGRDVNDFAGTLDRSTANNFLARTGYSGNQGRRGARDASAEERQHAMEEADHKFADAYGSLPHGQRGEVLSHMLFEPGHDAFWDRMVASGHISANTAEHAKGMAARLPAETQKQQQDIGAALDNAHLSPEGRAKAEEFKMSAEAKKLAEMVARAKQLEELAERARRNNDKAAKDIEEQAKREREAADNYRAELARRNPELAAGLKEYADRSGITSKSSERANAQDQEVQSLKNAELSVAQEAVKTKDQAAIEKMLLLDKTGAAADTSARAMISGSAESKVEAGKVLAANAVALGVVGEQQLGKAELAVKAAEAKKVETVAAKASVGLRADAAADAFDSEPPIASKLAQMRSQKEEAVPASAKTASMSA